MRGKCDSGTHCWQLQPLALHEDAWGVLVPLCGRPVVSSDHIIFLLKLTGCWSRVVQWSQGEAVQGCPQQCASAVCGGNLRQSAVAWCETTCWVCVSGWHAIGRLNTGLSGGEGVGARVGALAGGACDGGGMLVWRVYWVFK